MMRLTIRLFLLMLLVSSCTKPIATIEPTPYLDLTNSKGVYIGCEGNFMFGNASLSYYDSDTKQVENQVFFNTNNFPIGDVLQSTKIVGDELYLMVNNSGKIYIIDKNSLIYKDKISGLVSPRYIEFIDSEKAYITDLYSPSIAVLNTSTNTVGHGIEIGYSPTGNPRGTETMVRYKDYVITSSWSFSDQIYKIDTRTDKLVDSLKVTLQPNSIVIDKNDKLWVLSDGSYEGSPIGKERAALTRIDLEQWQIEEVFEFGNDYISPTRLCIDAQGENLYYIYGTSQIGNTSTNSSYGVYTMSVDSSVLPSEALIVAENRLIYGLAVNPFNGEIYLSDAINYVQRGKVYRYTSSGELVDSFESGVIPSSFTFKDVD